MKFGKLFSGCALFLGTLGLLGTAEAEEVQLRTFGLGHRTVLHSTYKLNSTQSAGYQEFRRTAGYFGAIAVHRGGKIFVWFKNMHSLSVAREAAIEGCQILARQDGEDTNFCELYASVIPKQLDPHDHRASGLGEGALKALIGNYPDTQIQGKFGAFAISGMADWGFSAGRVSEAEAIGAAITACEAAAAQETAKYTNDARRQIAERKLARCRVIHVTLP